MGIIDLQDDDPDTIELLLCYLYTNKYDDSTDTITAVPRPTSNSTLNPTSHSVAAAVTHSSGQPDATPSLGSSAHFTSVSHQI